MRVPKGTGLVETAASAGIEIPVFCYEPRLGPAVGACRMCLVEIEGLPKLQAGCTLGAQDGMVVHTAATSEKAAEGQNATLEFILVNHPLDCPVCDKGGECPLQDLTFRYGPGSTRMTFPKLTLEKPIPISPTIALDRERCILCYRCTRFSSDVAEDNQLVARNRGPTREIATFEERSLPGAVLRQRRSSSAPSARSRRPSTASRRGRGTSRTCRPCAASAPSAATSRATVREGKVKRILSRNHPEVDGGWLCDKGRFTYPHLHAPNRIAEPLARGRLGLEPISWDAASTAAESLLRGAGHEDRHRALRIGDARAGLRLSARLLRGGLGAHSAVLPESTSDALDAFRLPLSAIAEAEIVVIVGDDEVGDRAPVVDLWLKAGAPQRRRDRPRRPDRDRADAARAEQPTRAASSRAPGNELGEPPRAPSERAILVWSGRGGGGGARLAETAHALGLRGQARQRRVPPARDAERPRGRDGLGRGSRRGRGEPGADRAADRLGDEAAADSERARARRASRAA